VLRVIRPGSDIAAQEPRITQAWFECPDQGYPHLDVDLVNGGLKVAVANSGHYLTLSGGGYLRVAGLETPGSGALKLNASGDIVTS
jgi:hypothetical protein